MASLLSVGDEDLDLQNSDTVEAVVTERPLPAPDERFLAAPSPTRPQSGPLGLTTHHLAAAELSVESVLSAGEQQLSSALFMEIAQRVHNRQQCIKLAVCLKLSEDDVWKVLAERFTSKLPYNILAKWVETKRAQATGAVLYAALQRMGRQDLAEHFADKLVEGREVLETTAIVTQPLSERTSGDVSQLKPSIDLLVEIAFSLEKSKHCWRLAEHLQLGQDFVERVRAGAFAPEITVLNVFCEWTQQSSGEITNRRLFDALVATGRPDIAACFAERLLGRCEEDWEDFCYNNEHREFFRLLRRRHIDVVAAFECMHCSDVFLSRLHCKGILTQLEYEDLQDFRQTHSRPATNKKLLDTVNGKPSALQEMFVDVLCRWQPQLLMLDEEESLFSSDETIPTSPSQLHGQLLLQDFKDELKRCFNQLIVTRPFDFVTCQDYQPVSEIYVTLCSISYEEALNLMNGPHQLCGSDLLKAASRVDAESKHSRELIDLLSLLRYSEGVQANSALVFGSAGSGKSLTMLKILSEWISKNSTSSFQQFDAVIYITGRERSRICAKEESNLWQLWRMGYTEAQQRFILDHFLHHSDKVLFLIDAWDEAGEDGLLQDGTALQRILRGELFRHSSVIITSRPAPSTYPLLDTCKRRYSLVGFNNKRLQELFHRRLEEQQALKLFDMLSKPGYANVKSAMQKTPLFAAMLVQLYKIDQALPGTITALYDLMLDSIRHRYIQWVKDSQTNSRGDTLTFDKKASTLVFDEAVVKLSKLALAGCMSKKVTFTGEEVGSCGEAIVKPRFGLLSEVKEIGGHRRRILYHFNHLTWQEFLAACCLATDPDFIKKLQLCVHSIGVGEPTQLFWRFVAGLVNLHLLPDLVFELAKETGLSGMAPWEMEIRLFLLECVAESVRMREMVAEETFDSRYIRLATMTILTYGTTLELIGCMLDAGSLSSITIVMNANPTVTGFVILNCRVDHKMPSLSSALRYVQSVELVDICGLETASFVLDLIISLTNSQTVTRIVFQRITFTANCLAALAELMNMSRTLSKIVIDQCELGLAGMMRLASRFCRSVSICEFVITKNNLSGAGALLGQVCTRLPRLETLAVLGCHLDNSDMEGLLDCVHYNNHLELLTVADNLLTDAVAGPLIKFATHRVHIHSSLLSPTAAVKIHLGGNDVTESLYSTLSTLLPPGCEVTVTDGQLIAGPSQTTQFDHAAAVHGFLSSTTSEHVNMYQFPGGDYSAIALAKYLVTDYVHLKSLCLSESSISDNGALAIASTLSTCQLLGLDLSGNRVTLAGFHDMLAVLSGGFSSLQYLNVSGNPIFSRSGIQQSQLTPTVFNLCQTIHCLKIVSVGSTDFSDEFCCWENSPIALMAIPRLSALDLSNNKITDYGIAMITQWMDKLEYLSLSGNMITVDGCKVVIERAEAVLGDVGLPDRSAHRLQRIWLGGNCNDESIFTDCSCKVISRESFSIYDQNLSPMVVPFLFSALATNGSREGDSTSVPGPASLLFWANMNSIVQLEKFWDCIAHYCDNVDWTSFIRWLAIAAQSLAANDSRLRVVQERQETTVFKLFRNLGMWYSKNCVDMSMMVACVCCLLCVQDELAVTHHKPALQSLADESFAFIVSVSTQDGSLAQLIEQNLLSLAERCRRRQLHAVAGKLLWRREQLLLFS